MAQTTDQLMNDARCIDKCVPDGMKLAVLISIFQQLLANGTGGGGGGGLPTGPQAANTVLAGPTSGAPVAPTFRALVTADLGTTMTPQFARVGIGVAAGASVPLTILLAGIANVTTDGVLLENTTAATNAVQIQQSPAIHLSGFGWKTNAGGASEAVEWRIYGTSITQPVDPIGAIFIDSSVNGAAFVNRVRIGSDATLAADMVHADVNFNCAGNTGLTQTFDSGAGDTQISFVGGIAISIA